MENEKNTHLFYSLIYTFQMQAMFQMGKLKNPMTDKIEKDLDAAKISIDMLDMLADKTKNNTTDDEKRFLEHTVSDLKLNYVDEMDKEKKNKETPEKKDENIIDKEEDTEQKQDEIK
jgi:hypothetical protein